MQFMKKKIKDAFDKWLTSDLTSDQNYVKK